MSGKLDQSLDDIVSTRRQSNRRQARAPRVARTSVPTGGVLKSAKTARTKVQAVKAVVPAAGGKEGKILVSGLPADVDESTIKDYFSKSIGPVRRVMLTYGSTGVSRGQATVIFAKPNSAIEAAQTLNGITVDGTRKIKIEVIVGADKAQAVPAKTLSDRVTQPKSAAKTQQKSNARTNGTGAKGAQKGRVGRGRGKNVGRGKPKTADELDMEMTDYFDGNAAGAVNGSVATPVANGTAGTQIAAGGDNMDEIM